MFCFNESFFKFLNNNNFRNIIITYFKFHFDLHILFLFVDFLFPKVEWQVKAVFYCIAMCNWMKSILKLLGNVCLTNVLVDVTPSVNYDI